MIHISGTFVTSNLFKKHQLFLELHFAIGLIQRKWYRYMELWNFLILHHSTPALYLPSVNCFEGIFENYPYLNSLLKVKSKLIVFSPGCIMVPDSKRKGRCWLPLDLTLPPPAALTQSLCVHLSSMKSSSWVSDWVTVYLRPRNTPIWTYCLPPTRLLAWAMVLPALWVTQPLFQDVKTDRRHTKYCSNDI